MLLSKIINNYDLSNERLVPRKFNKFIQRLETVKNVLYTLRKNKQLKEFKTYMPNSNITKFDQYCQKDLNLSVGCIITIKSTNSNVSISLADVTGRLIYCYSAGNIDLKGRQKKKVPNVLKLLINHLMSRMTPIKTVPVTLHLKDLKSGYRTLVINLLQENFFIKRIKLYNLHPYNGCRPKKLKRKKQRTKSSRSKPIKNISIIPFEGEV